jgi:hypothetical protein
MQDAVSVSEGTVDALHTDARGAYSERMENPGKTITSELEIGGRGTQWQR